MSTKSQNPNVRFNNKLRRWNCERNFPQEIKAARDYNAAVEARKGSMEGVKIELSRRENFMPQVHDFVITRGGKDGKGNLLYLHQDKKNKNKYIFKSVDRNTVTTTVVSVLPRGKKISRNSAGFPYLAELV